MDNKKHIDHILCSSTLNLIKIRLKRLDDYIYFNLSSNSLGINCSFQLTHGEIFIQTVVEKRFNQKHIPIELIDEEAVYEEIKYLFTLMSDEDKKQKIIEYNEKIINSL